ncbi:hypothetical protein ACEPAG_2893 [Sanghuangporus baumii]
MSSATKAMTYRREGDSYGVGNGVGGSGDVSAPALELRASVLEAAVSLGFRNSVMKKWMDGDDDELTEHGTPALTSPSTTSEESALSPASFLIPTTSTSAYPYPYPYPLSSSRTNVINPGKPGQSSGAGFGIGVRANNDPTLYINPNGNIISSTSLGMGMGIGMGGRFSHDDDMMSANGSQKGPFSKLALAVPPPKNKLRKQKSAFRGIGGSGGANGYESDGGYISEVSKKSKSRKGLTWRRKIDFGDGDGEADSDAGYLSEAVSGSVAKARAKRKAKEKEKGKGKEGERMYVPREDAPSPMLPPMNLDNDPGALLATIKASVLPDSKSTGSATPSGSGSGSGLNGRTPEPVLPPATRALTSLSDNGHGPVSIRSATGTAIDGYLTDSASSEKRGRSKKKAKNGTKANKSRAGSPDGDDKRNTDNETRTPTKKKSLFRLMGRSVSRDAKDRDRGRERARSEEEVPPMPEPPRPPMPLPIAERFARSGASTPVGNAPASSSSSPLGPNPTDAQSGLHSSGSLSTLVPPTLRDPTFSRSESPWSYRSAPSRFGYADLEGMEVSSSGSTRRDDGRDSNSNSNSLELPRERRTSGGWSPFVVIPRDRTDSEMNTSDTNGGAGLQVQREAGRAGSPVQLRSVSPIVTSSIMNANQASVAGPSSPDTNKSPAKRIGKLFHPFGQSSKSDDGHSNESHTSNNSNTSSGAAAPAPPTSFSSSKPVISGPNPHLTRRGSLSLRFPSPMEIAAALTGSARGAMNGNANANANMNANDNDANGNAKSSTVTGEGIRSKTPESFIIIDEDEGVPTPMRQQHFTDANAGIPAGDSSSSPYLLVSAAGVSPSSPTRPNGTSTGLSARRRALLNGLGLDVTPMQSRFNTPTPINTSINPNASPNDDGIPNEDEVKAARVSVLAYYNVPPPSPPPMGPLPAPPHQGSSSSSPSGMRPVSLMQETSSNRQTLLAPGRAFASRSPSPLGLSPNNRYSSRSPSPGLGVGQGVRRGRESPFPTRPILPPQNRQELVERVERYKALYASAEGSGSDENGLGIDGGSGGSGGLDQKELNEFLDRHSSAYIRQARARGEKRVYFDTKHYSIKDAYYYGDEIEDEGDGNNGMDGVGFEYGDGYPRDVTTDGEVDDVDGDPVIPNINVHAEPDAKRDGLVYEDGFDEDTDERLRYSRQSLRDEFEDADVDKLTAKDKDADGLGDEESSTDRRSFAASSVYSQYSVLDADTSARFREGLVRRVAAMYSGGRKDEGRLLREEIPEVPKVPNEFRNIAGGGGVGGGGGAAAGQLGLKVTSSPYRF